jgi:hypothetical protein
MNKQIAKEIIKNDEVSVSLQNDKINEKSFDSNAIIPVPKNSINNGRKIPKPVKPPIQPPKTNNKNLTEESLLVVENSSRMAQISNPSVERREEPDSSPRLQL